MCVSPIPVASPNSPVRRGDASYSRASTTGPGARSPGRHRNRSGFCVAFWVWAVCGATQTATLWKARRRQSQPPRVAPSAALMVHRRMRLSLSPCRCLWKSNCCMRRSAAAPFSASSATWIWCAMAESCPQTLGGGAAASSHEQLTSSAAHLGRGCTSGAVELLQPARGLGQAQPGDEPDDEARDTRRQTHRDAKPHAHHARSVGARLHAPIP